MAIIIVVFIPFMIYAMACLIYFTLHQRRIKGTFLGEELDEPEWLEYYSRQVIYALSLYMFSFEVLQIYDFGRSYLLSLTNWIDQISTFFILVILFRNDFFHDRLYTIEYESIVATIAIAMTYYKVSNNLRLFDSTAFFFSLL